MGESIVAGPRDLRQSRAVAAIVNTCSLPARDEMNATWRPLGENAGLSLLPMPSVIARVLPVAKS